MAIPFLPPVDTLTQQIQTAITQVKAFPELALRYVMDRINKVDVFDETKVELQKESPWYQLGSIAYLYWIITVATGLFLVAFYIPTVFQAYDSIIAIKDDLILGIIRSCHKYGGDALIIASTLKVYRMWFNAEYKNKGELAFLLALIILVASMYSGLSGYLLIWNQRAFWATKIFGTFPTYLDIAPAVNYWFVPIITGFITKTIGELTNQGGNVSQILLGGSSIGQATMTRFYSLHFGISLVALVLSELYFYKARAKRINLSAMQIWFFIGILVFVAIVLPGEMGSRANPEVTPLPILSDWYFLALYQLLKYMDPYWATIWTVGIPFITLILAFLDFGPERNPWRRPIFTVAAIIGIIDFIVFSILIIMNIADITRDPPIWYTQMILMFTIGELWHFALYRQIWVWLAWVVPNLMLSSWYVFLHCIPKPKLPELMTWLYANEPFILNPSIKNPNDHSFLMIQSHPYFVMWLVFSLLLVALTVVFMMSLKTARPQAIKSEAKAA